MSPSTVLSCSSVSCHWILRELSLHFSSGSCREQQDNPSASISANLTYPKSLAAPRRTSSPVTHLVPIFWVYLKTFTSFLTCGAQNCSQCSREGSASAENSRIMGWLPVPCLMQLLVGFALVAHTEPAANQHPQVPFCSLFFSQFIFVPGVT